MHLENWKTIVFCVDYTIYGNVIFLIKNEVNLAIYLTMWLLPPPISGHIKNIYIYENVGIGPHANLSTPNAKIIFKGNTSVAT